MFWCFRVYFDLLSKPPNQRVYRAIEHIGIWPLCKGASEQQGRAMPTMLIAAIFSGLIVQ
jgi:hypothetical protein